MSLFTEFQSLESAQRQRLEAASGHRSPYSMEAASSRAVITKNRYRDIMPFDHNRVKLSTKQDYINASYITTGSQKWIAAQGPLDETCIDFWEMAVSFSNVIVMLCNIVELDRIKCANYFPDGVNERKQFDDLSTGRQATIECTEKVVHEDFQTVVRTMWIEFVSPQRTLRRTVQHVHFVAWPDHDVAALNSLELLLDLFSKLQLQSREGDYHIPTIHCSAGVGRTCTFVALYELRTDPKLSISGVVSDLRKQRIAGVQSLSQYALLHEFARQANER